MIGGTDLSKYLINFNSSAWAEQVNKQLQAALNQGLQYSEKYSQQAANVMQDYDKQAQAQMKQGFNQGQALDAPKHLATYNALDTYLGNLGQPTPVGGSLQLAKALENTTTGQPVTPQQQQMASGFNQGIQRLPLLSSPQQPNQGY